jgi:predicted amidohydrolase YtcJ
MINILHHAKIFSPGAQTASAIAIQDGRILDIGQEAGILDNYGQGAQLVDMQGATIWPGLTDAHIHLEHYSLSLQRLNCDGKSMEACLSLVAEKAKQLPQSAWILGHGWNQNDWIEGFGTAGMLDRVAQGHPVYLSSKSLHSAWVNTRALELAGIDAHRQDPPGGAIQRDNQGHATGILLESAVSLVTEVIPAPTPRQVSEAIDHAQHILWQMGITGVHDFDQSRCFTALQMLQQDNRLNLRVIKSIPIDQLAHVIGLGLRSGFGNDFLRTGSLKLFADGALGPHTAAMLLPYEDDPKNQGLLLLDAEAILDYGYRAVENGLSMAIHAIGDRAIHEVLNAYEQLRKYEKEHHLPALRHRIEHVQLLHPQDHARLNQLSIIASMQPIHATSDMRMADRFWGDRSANAYAWKAVLSHKTRLAFGSDAPVESPNPFLGLHAAVTRQRQDGSPGVNGWYPEQRLSLLEALNAYTTGAAYAAGMEDRLGKLTPGFYADLIVLEKDPFSLPPEQLANLKPNATMVSGNWVWQS